MAYRLVCIYEKVDRQAYRLRIEVCKDVGRMPPFIHKLKLDDVLREVREDQKQLTYLIYQSGCVDSSPYIIENQNFLGNGDVQSVLRTCPYIYIKASSRGSLRKGKFPLQQKLEIEVSEGYIVSKELYAREPGSWLQEIDARLRIEGVQNPIPTGGTFNYPIVKDDGSLVLENPDTVESLVSDLGTGYIPDSSILVLRTDQNPSEKLNTILAKGWTLYVPNQDGETTRVYSHTSSSGITWFSTEAFVDEDEISDKMLDCFLKSRDYVESDGRIILVNSKDVNTRNATDIAAMTGATQNVVSLYSNTVAVERSEIEYAVRKNINATLRPYQLDGVTWLQNQRMNGAGCLLADEMGLGKTLQVIAHLSCIETMKMHLVVAPVSLVYNWHLEIERFAPQLSEKIYVTSYDFLRIHLDDFIKTDYDTIVIDEAQIIKNRDTKKFKAITKLSCTHKIILTGTPIENSIEDIWSHFIMLNPGMQQMHDGLKRRGETMDSEQKVMLSAKLLKPFILRRTKEEVLKDLPEKNEETIYLSLSDKEQSVYNNLHRAVVRSLSTGLSGRVNSIVLEGLLRLRQTCVSANLLPYSLRASRHIDSTKLNNAVNYAQRIKSEKRKVIIFSQFVSALQELEGLMTSGDVQYVKLYGNTLDRKTPVESFEKDDNITAFLISLKAGGVGLNLTAADTIILLDDWWNPAVEDQAMGRAHRIGQTHTVFVYRFVCKNTVEEKILKLQEKKRTTVDVFENSSAVLSIEELKDILM